MNKIISLFSLLILLLSDHPSSAQTNIRYFPPERVKGDFGSIGEIIRDNQFVYISGTAFNAQPAIVKIDTSGREIWSVTLNMELDKDTSTIVKSWTGSILRNHWVSKMYIDSSRLYIYLQGHDYEIVMALDVKNGNLLWRGNYGRADFSWSLWDAGKELLLKLHDSYLLIDKKNGQTVFKKQLADFTTIYTDKDGSTYLTRKDTIEKYSSSRLESLLWQKPLYDPKIYSANVVAMVLRDDGYIYFYGERDNTSMYFIGKISKSDGTIAWKTEPLKVEGLYSVLDDLPREIIFKGDYIYVLPKDVFVGSTTTGFHAVKLKKDDGTVIWNKLYDEAGVPRVIYNSALNSGDIDANGNLYASGYYRGNEWRIMKLNAAGKFIYSTSIKADGNVTGDDEGFHTFVLDNKVYHIGLSNEMGVRKLFMATTDTSNSYKLLSIKNIQVTLQRPGSIKAMAPISGGAFVMYRQQDRNAVLEARNNGDQSVRWSTKFSGENYIEADRMHVLREEVITVTSLLHLSTDLSTNATADYQKDPEKILMGRYNVFGGAYQIKELINSYNYSFESVQLINGDASNAGYIFSANGYDDRYGLLPPRYYHVNLSLAAELFRASEIVGFSQPHAGRKQFLTDYINDSTLFGNDLLVNGKNRIRVSAFAYKPFVINPSEPNGGLKPAPVREPKMPDAHFTNFARVDGQTVTILARGVSSDVPMVVRYSVPKDSVIFVSTLSTSLALHNACSDSGNTYCMGSMGPSLAAIKLNNTTGHVIWEKSLEAAPLQCYFPLDQQINTHTNEYIVCGYIADSTYPVVSKSPFYVVFDVDGNVVQQWSGKPDYIGNNQLNTICITSDGQTLIGGSLYTRTTGKAAILITIGEEGQPVEIVEKGICTAGQLVLDARPGGDRYQWQIDRGNGFENLEDSVGIAGTATALLKIGGSALPRRQYAIKCVIDGNDDNRIFNVKIASDFKAEVTIKGDTLIRAGKEAIIIAKIAYGGEQPSLQWEDSTSAHSWMPIPGANRDTLTYLPSKMKNKVRCILTSSLSCVSEPVTMSKAMPVLIDPLTSIDPVPATQYGIKVFPNPVTDVLTISNLRVTDQWNAIQVLRMNGEMIYTMNSGAQTSVSIPAGKWEAGMYILILRKKNGESARFRFVKM